MSIEGGSFYTKQEEVELEPEKELAAIKKKAQELEERLKAMESTEEGSEMRKILDKEYRLNSAISPIDATDANRSVEYNDWVNALKDSKRAEQERKNNLERKIEAAKAEILKLGERQYTLEERIRRGK